MAHGERVGGGAAVRRRGRRFRMFWRHEQLSLRMMRAAMEHHSWQRCSNLCDAARQTDAAPAPVEGTEYIRMCEESSDVQEQVTEQETPDVWLFFHERVQQCADDERAHVFLTLPERVSERRMDADLGVQVETPFPLGPVQQSLSQVPFSMLVSPQAVLESLSEAHVVERASRVLVPRTVLPLVDEEPGGSRPPCLGEPRGPQERIQPHTLEQLADVVPRFRSWTFLWRRRGRRRRETSWWLCSSTSTPKKSKSFLELCFVPMEHQTAEQLVEVPTVVSFSSLQWTAEQSIDIPGTRRRRGGGRGHSSTASVGSRSRRFLFRVVVEVWAVEVFKGSLQDIIQQRLCRSRSLTFQFRTVVSQILSKDRVKSFILKFSYWEEGF